MSARDEERISLPGYGRDWRCYAAACGVAGVLTASVPYFTRRTYLPFTVPEPPMIYSRRISSRAFLYATCINIFLGIGCFGGGAFYFEIDNIHDVGWKIRRKMRAEAVHESSMAHSVKQSAHSVREWFSQTWLGQTIDYYSKPQLNPEEAEAGTVVNTDPNATNEIDQSVDEWFRETDQLLTDMWNSESKSEESSSDDLSPSSQSKAATAQSTRSTVSETAKTTASAVPAPLASQRSTSSTSVSSPSQKSTSLDQKLRDFDAWFDQTSVGKFVLSLQTPSSSPSQPSSPASSSSPSSTASSESSSSKSKPL